MPSSGGSKGGSSSGGGSKGGSSSGSTSKGGSGTKGGSSDGNKPKPPKDADTTAGGTSAGVSVPKSTPSYKKHDGGSGMDVDTDVILFAILIILLLCAAMFLFAGPNAPVKRRRKH